MSRDKKLEIFERLGEGIADLVPELEPRRRGGAYEVDCPECGEKRRAYLYLPNNAHPAPRIVCNRGSCGYRSSLLDYIMGRDRLSFGEALSMLGKLAGVETSWKPEDEAAWKLKHEEKETLERIADFFERTLWSPEGGETLDYLRNRGYSDEEIKAMGLGCFPGAGKTLSFLGEIQGGTPEALSYAITGGGSRGDYKLVFPYRAPDGTISTFLGRLTRPLQEGEKEADKYKPLGEYAGVKAAPFGAHALRGDAAILVEGQLDALAAGAAGIANVVSLGGSNLVDGQLDALRRKGIKKLILCLDGDEAGKKGAEAIVRKTLGEDFSVFVAEIEGAKDPDELIRTRGADALRKTLEQAGADGRGIKWLLRRIAGKHDLTTDMGRTDAFKDMEALIRGLRHPLDVKEATGIMGEALELDPWDLEPFLETARERAERDALARELEKTLRQAGEKVKDEPEEALSLLRGRIETEDRRNREGLAENLFPDFSMDHLVSCLTRAGDGLSTGFKELDKRLRIPRGAITLIAGRPGHGKTRTLLNLLRRQMEMEPGKRYVFASYEEDAHVIITKLLISMARAELGENRQGYIGAYMKYLRGAYIPRPDDLSIIDGESIMGKVETAWKTLRSALESKRLIVAYRPGDARELGDSIRALSEKYGDELGAVFVDYMQLLPLPEGESISSAYQKVQAASGIMRDAAVKTNLPIICGAQLNRASSKSDTGQKKGKFNLANVLRPEYLREAGDLEQDANLAIGVYDAAAGLKEQDGADEGNIAPFSMLTMKNRNGSTGETFGLDVAPEFWRLDDEEQAPGIEGDLREKIGLPPKKNGSRVDAGAADRAKFQQDHAAGYEMNASTGKRWGD